MVSRKLPLFFPVIFVGMSFQMKVESAELLQPLSTYIKARTAEFDDIPADRRERLNELAAYVRSNHDENQPIEITFICTHNSRRSQMVQIWTTIAAAHYSVPGVKAYSGGTEGTAFNPRAVAALQRAGIKIEQQNNAPNADNPRYNVVFSPDTTPLVCFSKVYGARPNPDADFAAVMTCSEADKNCPDVSGAAARIALPYDDPKVSDGATDEAKTYDERCSQIAREMLYVFSKIKRQS